MNRREFLTLAGAAATTWPMTTAHAQRAPLPVVGFIHGGSAASRAGLVSAFKAGLEGRGFVDGRGLEIDYRWADDLSDRIPGLVAELVRRPVSVIAAVGGEPTVIPAKALTSTIPIVFIVGGDPVKLGLVASFAKPGGSLTGINMFSVELQAKRMGLLHEIVPPAKPVAHLVDPGFPPSVATAAELEKAAERLGRQLINARIKSGQDLDAAFATIVQTGAGAVIAGAGPLFNSLRNRIIALAADHALPAIFEFRESAVAGGLISYGTNLADAYRHVGDYCGRILKGDRPADLPVVQPTRFELVINLKTARTLGIELPATILAIADEVIA